jgi:hypothetical protein
MIAVKAFERCATDSGSTYKTLEKHVLGRFVLFKKIDIHLFGESNLDHILLFIW